MAEELLNVPKLTIRHYKSKSLYDSYSGSRNDGDISIIGDSMSVYSISVIDNLVSKVNANIEINAKKLKEIAESGISQLNGQTSDIKANTYTKVEADRKFQPKGNYVYKEEYDSGQTNMYNAINTKAYKDDVYTKEEVDEKVTGLSKNVYTKVEADGNFQPKGKYVKEEYLQQLESAWSDELDKKAEKDDVEEFLSEKANKTDVYTKEEVTNTYLSKLNFKDKLLEVLGVRYSIEENGYICFGPLFGGLIIQWGKVLKSTYGYGHPFFTLTFPIKYISNPSVFITYSNSGSWSAGGDLNCDVVSNVTTQSFYGRFDDIDTCYWFSIGR